MRYHHPLPTMRRMGAKQTGESTSWLLLLPLPRRPNPQREKR
jgi:hypothetical protein